MWSRRSIEIFAGVSLLAALAACSVTPQRRAAPAVSATAAHPAVRGKAGVAGAVAQPGAAPGPAPIPPEAQLEFAKALALARAGSDTAAEAQLARLAQQYSQFCAPLVDLGILYRKNGNLRAATRALEQAVARNPHSAAAWTELGVTQRLGGKFQDAGQSYARAIAADATYAPAYRDRGVLRDLYLDQPAAALNDFEQYRKLNGRDKPVAMWIAELQHRTGIKAPAGGEIAPRTAGVSAPSVPAAARTGSAAPASPPQARN
jgi:tetratricopeptide (TPR) repeat protein